MSTVFENKVNDVLEHFGISGMKWGKRKLGKLKKVGGIIAGGMMGNLAIRGLSYATNKHLDGIAKIIDGGDKLGYGIANAMNRTLSHPQVQALAIVGSAYIGEKLSNKKHNNP